MCVDGANFKGR